MRWSRAARWLTWLIVGVTLAPLGCRRSRDVFDAGSAAPRACTSNQNCDDGWACLAGRCADARKIGAFTHSEQMVTPDKVRQELERQQQQHVRGIDDALKGTDPPGN